METFGGYALAASLAMATDPTIRLLFIEQV